MLALVHLSPLVLADGINLAPEFVNKQFNNYFIVQLKINLIELVTPCLVQILHTRALSRVNLLGLGLLLLLGRFHRFLLLVNNVWYSKTECGSNPFSCPYIRFSWGRCWLTFIVFTSKILCDNPILWSPINL